MSASILARTAHGLPLLELRDFERCILPGVCGNKARKLASLGARPYLPPLVSHRRPPGLPPSPELRKKD